jgi:hypothetical protein
MTEPTVEEKRREERQVGKEIEVNKNDGGGLNAEHRASRAIIVK